MTKENTKMIIPAGHRVLIKPDKFIEKDETVRKARELGIKLPDTAVERDEHAVVEGTVVLIGHSAWRAYDPNWEGWKAWCKIGDKVLYAKFAGSTHIDPEDGEEYRLLNDDDIKAIITTGDTNE